MAAGQGRRSSRQTFFIVAAVLVVVCGGPMIWVDLHTPVRFLAEKERPGWAQAGEGGIQILQAPELLSVDSLEPVPDPRGKAGMSIRSLPDQDAWAWRHGDDLFVDSHDTKFAAWARFRFGQDEAVAVEGYWASTPCIEELQGTVVLSSLTNWSEGVHFAYFLVGVDRCSWSARWFEWPVTLSGEVWIEG